MKEITKENIQHFGGRQPGKSTLMKNLADEYQRSTKSIQLFEGDCIEQMKKIPTGTVNMILADLPYGTTRCKWDNVIPFSPMWSEIERITTDNAAILLFAAAPFDKTLACSNIKLFRHEWIWEKPSATGFFNAKKMPLKAHENILVFYKSMPTYNPQKSTGNTRKVSRAKVVQSECYGKQIGVKHYDSTERYPRSVIKFSSDKQYNNLHPTQKPLALCEYLINTYTNPGDLIVDFCMGSGTSGVASKNLNRNFIGIEKDSHYFSIAKNRINQTLETKQ